MTLIFGFISELWQTIANVVWKSQRTFLEQHKEGEKFANKTLVCEAHILLLSQYQVFILQLLGQKILEINKGDIKLGWHPSSVQWAGVQ